MTSAGRIRAYPPRGARRPSGASALPGRRWSGARAEFVPLCFRGVAPGPHGPPSRRQPLCRPPPPARRLEHGDADQLEPNIFVGSTKES